MLKAGLKKKLAKAIALHQLMAAGTGAGGVPPGGGMPVRTPMPMPMPPAAGPGPGMRKGGKVKKYAGGGSVRGDGCASKGKTKGKMC